MLRSQFEEQLEKLHNQFYEMGTAVNRSIRQSVRSFVEHDKTLAQEVIENDSTINELEVSLERKSFEMIALQQPMASDLRRIITVMKASSDLERIGDHAVSISQATINVKGEVRIPKVEGMLAELGEKVKESSESILKAYLLGDLDKALEIAKNDAQIDEMAALTHTATLEYMKENPETIVAGSDYLKVATYLERIGDYVTNIAEWISYLDTGKIVDLSSKPEVE